MLEEEKNVNKWSACVVSAGTWGINESINSGDHIYRIFNDKFDLKANLVFEKNKRTQDIKNKKKKI